MKTRTLLTSLLLAALSAVVVTARITSTSTSSTATDIHRLLTNENPSAVCVPEKLLEHCPDESVTPAHLTQRCGGTYRLKAIRCYMEYLCENGHGQETVNSHKECMNNECAMAKRMGPLNCQEHLDSLNNDNEETTDQSTTTTTNTEEESSTPTESTPTEEEPSATEEESSTTEEQSTTEEAAKEGEESTTQEASGPSNNSNNSTEEIHEDSGEINEQQQQQQEKPKEEESKEKASGGAIAFVVFAAVAFAGVLYMYRGELLGKNREQFPGDSHIVANGNANLAPGQQADDDHQIT
ncbi:expressed unknown protein [Seminavis robusta]|uniref:Uncharacterized protein n=1 Tax=Seminavis robusta TaxID=568900 RepID=A0A9N8E9J0_9STRA|nr:expressed unknown protein [Seminavis robusta]|eukprot:Sro776_g200910.1 n/a (296) ;mRNA; r:24370-25257